MKKVVFCLAVVGVLLGHASAALAQGCGQAHAGDTFRWHVHQGISQTLPAVAYCGPGIAYISLTNPPGNPTAQVTYSIGGPLSGQLAPFFDCVSTTRNPTVGCSSTPFNVFAGTTFVLATDVSRTTWAGSGDLEFIISYQFVGGPTTGQALELEVSYLDDLAVGACPTPPRLSEPQFIPRSGCR